MPYSFTSDIRYSECDSDGYLTPFSVINYLQDCSTFQSEKLGVGIGYLKERKRAWFLNSWHIIFDRYPHFGETIETGTFAYGFSGLYGYRHFYIKGGQGEFLVRADSLWFFFDTEKQMPTKPDEQDMAPYMERDAERLKAEIDMPPLKRKIVLPKDMRSGGGGSPEACEEIEVTRHFLDSNKHVNNAWYVEMAASAAGMDRPSELRAEYRKAAVLSDHIRPLIVNDGEKRIVDLSDRGGSPFAIVELMP